MPPTIISKKASNWVDRGAPPNPTLRRVLAHFFERLGPADEPWLEERALIPGAVTPLVPGVPHAVHDHRALS
jgi:hypothetical protein